MTTANVNPAEIARFDSLAARWWDPDGESRPLHDLNPVRARMTDDPASYPWSSAPNHCGLRDAPWLTPHPAYLGLAPSAEARADAYRQLLREVLSDDDLAAIRIYLKQQRALGRDTFRAMVEAKTRRFAGVRPAHRPPRTR